MEQQIDMYGNPVKNEIGDRESFASTEYYNAFLNMAFSPMQYAPFLDRLELRIDALDDGFYLDMQEASVYYDADFLQDWFQRDLTVLYGKAAEKFIRIQHFEQDLICSPCILMSKDCIKTAEMYQPDIVYKRVKLWDSDSGVNRTYFLSILNELDCMSDQI